MPAPTLPSLLTAAAPTGSLPGGLKTLPPDLRALDVGAPLADKVSWTTYSHELAALAVNLAVAVLVLIVTTWLARTLSGMVRRLLTRANHGDVDGTLPAFGASMTRYLITIIGVVAALQQLGVRTTSVLAVLGAASLAVGLALQGALSNVAAGVMILLFRPYRIGHYVEIGGKQGVVKTLDLFATELATVDNLRVVVPNSKIFGDVITNWSAHDRRRVDVVFHVLPGRDLSEVFEGMKRFIEGHPLALDTPAPILEAMSLNEVYAEGAVRVWVKPADYGPLRSDLVLQAQRLAQAPPPPPAEASAAKTDQG
jgi:small conductance mechanosensitive channel